MEEARVEAIKATKVNKLSKKAGIEHAILAVLFFTVSKSSKENLKRDCSYSAWEKKFWFNEDLLGDHVLTCDKINAFVGSCLRANSKLKQTPREAQILLKTGEQMKLEFNKRSWSD